MTYRSSYGRIFAQQQLTNITLNPYMEQKIVLVVKWYDKLKDAHIDAAIEYLSLFFKNHELDEVHKKLLKHEKDLVSYKAKDILRASDLSPLPATDTEVAEHLKKIREGIPLHPVILVSIKEKLYVADGFHRVSACYSLSDDTEVSGAHIEL
jgi:hypothetical protein